VTWRFAGLAAILVAAAGASLLVGGTSLSLRDLADALTHPHSGGPLNAIVWQLRLPRICIAATVGACLAMCGALLQGMLRSISRA
jgi:iron complex transport system permease protein